MTRYMRWLEAERGRSFGDYQALWEWSVGRAGGILGLDLGLLRGRRVGAVLRGPARTRDAGRQVVCRRRAELRRAHLPWQARHGPRRAARVRAAPARRAALGGAAGAGRSRRRRASRPGGRARGSRRRLHAERARNAGRLPGDRIARCHLVELLAGLRRLERRRPLRADRAQGDVLRRRLPLQRQGLRSDRDGRGAAAADADARAHRRRSLPRPRARPLAPGKRRHLGRAAGGGRGRGASIRAGAVRPSALGPVLVGDHRPAEGDRAGPRRDPAGAPEEAPPPRRRAG